LLFFPEPIVVALYQEFFFATKTFKKQLMPRVKREVLKKLFDNGAKPNGAQFATFIDSVFNFAEDTSLLGLNNFDATLKYDTGDTVVLSKIIYQANKPTGPGSFIFADWDKIAGGTTGLQYKGPWDANANVPDLVNATPSAGDYYIVSVAGNTNLSGITDWGVNDWAISNGINWAKIDNSQGVTDATSLGSGIAIFKQNLNAILQFLSVTSVDGSVKLTGSSNTLDLGVQFDDSNTAPNRVWSSYKTDQELAAKEPANSNIQAHIADINNPHNVTKAQLNLGFVQNTRVNYTATTDPGSSDDSTQSYSVGSMWINNTTKVFYICVDATAGAAVWKDEGEITDGQNTGSGAGIFKARSGSLLQFLSLLSGNGSLQITPSTDTIDLSIAFGDGGTSPNQAWSAFKTNQQLGTKEPANPNIQAHIANFSNPHMVTAAQVGLGNVQNIKDNYAATTDPTSANDSSQSYSVGSKWINTTLQKEFVCLSAAVGNAVWRETTSYFGNDYDYIQSSGRTSTSSFVFQNKVVLSTGTKSGTYRIQWQAVIDNNIKKPGEFRLYNVTAGTAIGSSLLFETVSSSEKRPVGGFALITLSGASQDIAIQFRAITAGDQQGIQDASIEIFRKS
jgi:hypothetical protein